MTGIKKAHKTARVQQLDKTIFIGDQLMTDIWAANRFNVYNILVNPLKKKTEKWYTKFNRKTETKMIEKIKKNYPNRYKDLKLDSRK